MCCGVVRILFGWFLRVPSLHALVFLWKTFCDLFLLFFFWNCFLEMVREKRGGKGKMHNLESMKIYNCVVHKEKRIIINSKASK